MMKMVVRWERRVEESKEEEYEGLDDVKRTVEGVTRYVARDDDGCVDGDADDEEGGRGEWKRKRRRVWD